MEFYDADYFERGIETGKSAYQNYTWLPELTIPMAMTLIDYLGLTQKHSILDYGCSKGYVVKSLRLLRRNAFGVDISDYALQNIDPVIKDFCGKVEYNENGTFNFMIQDCPEEYDWVIAKDVLEHIPDKMLANLLRTLPSKNLFVCVPLGENGVYRSPINNYDKSHIICRDEFWWGDLLKLSNWSINEFTFAINGIKENHYTVSPNGHGFFICERF